jgi:hypothetical protein
LTAVAEYTIHVLLENVGDGLVEEGVGRGHTDGEHP